MKKFMILFIIMWIISTMGFTKKRVIALVKVSKPAGYSNWKEGTTQLIKWDKKNTKGRTVKIQLYKADGKTLIRTIKTLQFNSSPYYISPNQYNWTIPNGTFKFPGTYKVKISALNGLILGFSKTFRISINTITKKYYIRPSIVNKKRKKHERITGYTADNFGTKCSPAFEVPTIYNMRIGYENTWQENREFYCGFVYRSRIIFDINHLKNKGVILNAKLLYKTSHGSLCSVKVWFLEQNWSNIMNATGSYISNPKNIQPSLIAKWFSLGNFGLLLTGADENFSHNNNNCVIIAHDVQLELEILEKR